MKERYLSKKPGGYMRFGKLNLKEVEDLNFWALSQYQSLSMCLNDAQAIADGQIIQYGMDGYDLCRYILPKGFYIGKPNPHHYAMKVSWQSYFDKCNSEITYATLSPFSILELLATIEERASDRTLSKVLREKYTTIDEVLNQINEIAKGIININDLPYKQRELIRKLYLSMRYKKTIARIVQNEDMFAQLKLLLNEGKIKLFDPIIKELAPHGYLENLLSYDYDKLRKPLDYLREKRRSWDSDYQHLYNLIDIYHYVLFNSTKDIFAKNSVKSLIASSGILSRNSWILLEYGKLFDDIKGIPDDWSGRAGNVPAYLMRAYIKFKGDLIELHHFFEEGRALARVILKDLRDIPELRACIESGSERSRLHNINPEIGIKNKVGQAIIRFQQDYLIVVVPELLNLLPIEVDTPDKPIDFDALVEWIKNPTGREKIYKAIIEQVKEQLTPINIAPVDWRQYIAPIGDAFFEILAKYDNGLDR